MYCIKSSFFYNKWKLIDIHTLCVYWCHTEMVRFLLMKLISYKPHDRKVDTSNAFSTFRSQCWKLQSGSNNWSIQSQHKQSSGIEFYNSNNAINITKAYRLKGAFNRMIITLCFMTTINLSTIFGSTASNSYVKCCAFACWGNKRGCTKVVSWGMKAPLP